MSLINKLFFPKTVAKKKPIPLAEYFLDLIGRPDFPLKLAHDAFYALKKTAKSEEQLYEFLLEDIIFTSIYSTFYEEVFRALKKHPQLANGLVDKFSKDEKDRESLIASHTHYHLSFVMNMGDCSGCISCDNHQEVAQLVSYWQKGDVDFLLNMYIGMQTIQFAMEHLLFDIIPTNNRICQELSFENIQGFRQYIFEYAGENS